MFSSLQISLPATLALLAATTQASPLEKRTVGGVRLCDQVNWAGDCWYGVWPLTTCVALNSFAGKVLSFRPDDGTECFLMQGRCNASDEYGDFYHTSADISDLSSYPWIEDASSFICFAPLTPLKEKMRHLAKFKLGAAAVK